MFHYWISLVLLLQLSALSNCLVCQVCDQTLQLGSSDVISPTNCTSSNSSPKMCYATLVINHQTNAVYLDLDEVKDEDLPDDITKTFVAGEISISITSGMGSRSLQLYCPDTGSCLNYINATYNEIKKQNYTQLMKDLQGQLLGNVSASSRLLCHASPNQMVSCLGGLCELSSGGGSSFIRRCRSGATDLSVQISSRTVDNESVESMFTYNCNKNSCNDEVAGNEVRKRLNETGLLSPRGVKTLGSAGNSISPMMALSLAACIWVLFEH